MDAGSTGSRLGVVSVSARRGPGGGSGGLAWTLAASLTTAVLGAAVLADPTAPQTPATRPATAPADVPPPPRGQVGGVELRPVPRALAVANPVVLDAEVEAAIRDGAEYLLNQFDGDELPKVPPEYDVHRYGFHALAVYALLAAGQAVDEPKLSPTDPRIARLIDRLKSYKLDRDPKLPGRPLTFARSFRAAALALANREADRAALKADVDWLVAAHYHGGYSNDDKVASFVPKPPPPQVVGPPVGVVGGGGPPPTNAGVGGKPPPYQPRPAQPVKVGGTTPAARQQQPAVKTPGLLPNTKQLVPKPKTGMQIRAETYRRKYAFGGGGGSIPIKKPPRVYPPRIEYPEPVERNYGRRVPPRPFQIIRWKTPLDIYGSGRGSAARKPTNYPIGYRNYIGPPVRVERVPRPAGAAGDLASYYRSRDLGVYLPPSGTVRRGDGSPDAGGGVPAGGGGMIGRGGISNGPGVERRVEVTDNRTRNNPSPADDGGDPDAPPWDSLNSQLAPFGVWSGAEAGIRVPDTYWADVAEHWAAVQSEDGTWPLFPEDVDADGNPLGSLAATAGGVATTLIAADGASRKDLLSAYLPDDPPPELARGLAWLDVGDRAIGTPSRGTQLVGFDLFAVARAGLTSGRKFFGSHDWYRELAERVVPAQNTDGSWGPPGSLALADTALHVAFLSVGRHPVFANKLKFDGPWNARRLDVANAARDASAAAERPLNWGVVSLDRAGVDWLDAPVLFVATEEVPRLFDADYAKIREYVGSGGMVYLHADKGNGAVGKWAAEFCKRVCPDFPLADLPADHPLYAVTHKLTPTKLRLRAATNGSRVLVLLSPTDVAGAWQSRAKQAEPDAFKLATNVFGYATGRARARYRLQTLDIPAPPKPPAVTIPVARVKWGGNWDPEAGAWARTSRFLQWEAGAAAEAVPTPAADLAASKAKLAHLTGTGAYAPTAEEAAGLRAYVEAGGVLLVDACGGDAAFRKSFDEKVAAAFPGLQMAAADKSTAPFLSAAVDVMDDLTAGPPEVRAFAARGGPGGATLKVGRFGKGWVVYSPLDLSTGLAGSNAWGVAGYEPDYAVGLVKNVLVWAATRGTQE